MLVIQAELCRACVSKRFILQCSGKRMTPEALALALNSAGGMKIGGSTPKSGLKSSEFAQWHGGAELLPPAPGYRGKLLQGTFGHADGIGAVGAMAGLAARRPKAAPGRMAWHGQSR